LEVVVHPLVLPLLLTLQTPVDATAPTTPITSTATATADTRLPTSWTLWGSIEGYGQWNFNTPENGITNFRAFDNRHSSLSLKNAMLGVTFDVENVVGVLTGQVGATGATYYSAEPALAGATGANASSAALWQFLQQANLGYRLPIHRGVLLQGGLFLSPIGPESMPAKDNWFASNSTLFFGLPFYHTGMRATVVDAFAGLLDGVDVTAAVYNGWNSVVDNNVGKSVSGQLLWTMPDTLVVSLLYFGGVERNDGAPEGAAWRHLIDSYVTWTATPWLSLQWHGDVGVEAGDFGPGGWAATAMAVRIQPLPFLSVAARGDVLAEQVARNNAGTASAIFFPADRVGAATLTIDLRPAPTLSLRTELRHDQASAPIYFRDAVAVDTTGAFLPDADGQTTITVAAIAWF
jgi:hypothetical protein